MTINTPTRDGPRFRILGPVEVSHAGVLVTLGGPRHYRLLAVLLVYANQLVGAGRLIEALWGEEPPRSAAAMLHVRISELRKALRASNRDGTGGIITRGSGYMLQVGADELDSYIFERLASAGRQALIGGDPVAAAASLGDALALWRGPALADVAELSFARAEATRLNGLRVQALEDRIDADLLLGRHRSLILELEALVVEHPIRERLWSQLMLALYRAGRQGDALSAFQAVRRLLIERIGVEPGEELRRLQTAVLRHDPALEDYISESSSRQDESPGNLPAQLTSFVGRDRDVVEIRRLLRVSRLVTLTGVGGAGKSRLAIEAAATDRAAHAGGTWLVELATLTQPGLAVRAVADTLGVHVQPGRPLLDTLAERIGTDEALLILDNCEHIIDEVCGLTQTLLGACTQLRILATSRERLSITGETLRPVSGLTMPQPGTRVVSAVAKSDAAQLLVERAASVEPGFRLCADTAAAVAHICQRLDGLPLALELAAAQVNTYGIEQIAARLDDRFTLLTQGSRTALGRHQTLRAVVDWSYELLSHPERQLFDRLSGFVGGFTLEAVEAVCAEHGDRAETVMKVLGRLVDKSLVLAEPTGPAGRRYRTLETLRAYGSERLEERGETSRVRDRHAAFFLTFAEPAGEALRSRKRPIWLTRLETEHANLRQALEWSIGQGDAETAVRLAGSLYPFWDLRGHYAEGRRWLARALDLPGQVAPTARTRALLGASTLAVIQGDLRSAVAACEEASALCRQIGDHAGLAHTLQQLGYVAIIAGQPARATELLEQSLHHARTTGHRWLMGWSLLFLATNAVGQAQHDQATRFCAEAIEALRLAGDPEGVAWALITHAAGAWRAGDRASAREPLREGLRAFYDLGGRWGLSLGLFVAGQLAGARGNHQRLVALLSASEAVRESVGAGMLPFVRKWLDTAIEQARAAVGPEGFSQAWHTGRGWSVDAAVAEAMLELDLADGPRPESPDRTSLAHPLRRPRHPMHGRRG